MPRGNRKLIENSLKRAFIARLEEAGIDPQTVDLSIYDFHSFETIDDLLQFYARHGDPIASRLINSDYNVEYMAHAYKNYLESIEDQNIDQKLEKLEVEIDEVSKKLMLLEDRLERVNTLSIPQDIHQDIHEEINALKSEIMALKQNSNKNVENMISKITSEINNIKMRLEELNPKPRIQTTLPEYGPPMEIELIPEPDPDHKPANMKPAKKRNPRITAGLIRVTLIHVIGLFISYIISDMSGVSMLFTFMVFIVIAWLDTLTWLPYHGPSRRGFATGYLYSQYTNPYKAGRGR